MVSPNSVPNGVRTTRSQNAAFAVARQPSNGAPTWIVPTRPSPEIWYQSTLTERSGSADGVSVKPKLTVSAVSGIRSVLPPVSTPHCAEGHCGILPYWAAVTPVRWHSASVAAGVGPAQGSAENCEVLVTVCGLYSSIRLGARIAWLNEPRKRIESTGAHCKPSLYVSTPPDCS